MLLYRRRRGSQRGMSPLRVELQLNMPGGCDLTLLGSDGVYYIIVPETATEAQDLRREIMAAISHRRD